MYKYVGMAWHGLAFGVGVLCILGEAFSAVNMEGGCLVWCAGWMRVQCEGTSSNIED